MIKLLFNINSSSLCRKTRFPLNDSNTEKLCFTQFTTSIFWNRSLAPSDLLVYTISWVLNILLSHIKEYTQLTLIWPKSPIETIKKCWKMSMKLFWYIYCQLWTHFTPFSSVSMGDLKQISISRINLSNRRKIKFWFYGLEAVVWKCPSK